MGERIMLFNCFAFLVAFAALYSRHMWKARCKSAEFICDELAEDVVKGYLAKGDK
jgi:hypothetical protein